ncbi:MAG: hypothetical protein ACLR5T_04180 [Veillonella sp.]
MLPALQPVGIKTPKEYTGQIFSYNQSCLSIGYFLGSFGGSIVAAQFGFTTLSGHVYLYRRCTMGCVKTKVMP